MSPSRARQRSRDPARIVARAFERGDLDGCLEVFDTNVPRFFTPSERAQFTTFLEALPGPYSVLLDETGLIVACGGHALVDGGRTADLCWGMVRRELHGQSLGRRLTEARLQQIRAEPTVREVALNTSQFTSGFYERMGFHVIEIVRDGYAPGLDRYEMRLEVGGPTRAGEER